MTPIELKELLRDLGIESKVVGTEVALLCPFHTDSHPSLYVSPQKGVFYCHGCGARGSIWKLLTDGFGIDRQEASKVILKMGLEDQLKPPPPEVAARMAYLKRAKVLLEGSKEAMAFFEYRGYNRDFVLSLPIGFGGTSKAFRDRELLRMAGVVKDGQYLMANRIVFGLSCTWELCAFTGRRLPKPGASNRGPKYKTVGKRAFFRLGRGEIVYVTEGPLDAMRVYQKTGAHVVAKVGSRMTADQASSLRRLGVHTAIIIPDNDQSGFLGAIGDAITLVRAGIYPLVVPVDKIFGKTCKDIDEYGREHEFSLADLKPESAPRFADHRGYHMLVADLYREARNAPFSVAHKLAQDFSEIGNFSALISDMEPNPEDPEFITQIAVAIVNGDKGTEELMETYGPSRVSAVSAILRSTGVPWEVIRRDAEALITIFGDIFLDDNEKIKPESEK